MKNFFNGLNRRNTNCIKWDRDEKDILPFWIADSDYPVPDCITEGLKKQVNNRAFGYTFIDDEYFDLVKKWVNDRYNYNIETSWIVPTPGVVTALYLFVNLFTEVSDNVVVSTPVYNPFYNVVNVNNRTLVCNKLVEKGNSYYYDFDDLEEKLKTAKMYILCNPHNPVGRCWKKEEIEKIILLCKKYDVFLVSDEIHCDIILDGKKHNSIGHLFSLYDKMGICTAPSKTFNVAGLMDANIIIKNEEIRQTFYKKLRELSISEPNIFGICACKCAYRDGHSWVDNQNKYLSENRNIVEEFFKTNVPKSIVYRLEGTYLMWINLSYLNISEKELMEGLLKEKVHVNSGKVYSSDYDGYIRLNIACGREQLLEGLKRINSFIKKL